MLPKKLTDKEFRTILSNLFVFNELIGEGNMMEYRADIDECMDRVKENKEVNVWIMDVEKYKSKQRQGEGWVSLGVRQVSSAVGSVSVGLFGSDTAAIIAKFSLKNILRSVYNEREKLLMLEILLESTFIWEEEVVPVIPRKEFRSMKDASEQLENYKTFMNTLNIYEVTKRLYLRYGDNENISEWTRFHMRVSNDEYASLLKKIKILLSNKLDDVQLPNMLISLQKQVDDMDRITKKIGGAKIIKYK